MPKGESHVLALAATGVLWLREGSGVEGLGAGRGCLQALAREESPGLCRLVQAVTMSKSVTS